MEKDNDNSNGTNGSADSSKANDFLNDYQESKRITKSLGFMGQLKARSRKVKLRACAIKLRHEIKNLNKPLEAAFEELGMLAISHQPQELNIAAEQDQLKDIQTKLKDTKEALQNLQTSHSDSSTIKKMQSELRQFQDQSLKIMVGIGKKVESQRLNLPDSGKHYITIDHIRDNLQSKQAQMQRIEAEIGTAVELIQPTSNKGIFKIVGILLLLVVLSGLGKTIIGTNNGGMGRLGNYIPDDPFFIAFLCADEIQDSSIYKDFGAGKLLDTIEKLVEAEESIRIDTEDIEKIMITCEGLNDSDFFAVIETHKDHSLEEIINLESLENKFSRYSRERGPHKPEIINYQGVDYISMSFLGNGQFIARLDDSLYCITDRENILKQVIDRGQKTEAPEFVNDQFKKTFEYVSQEDAFFVMSIPNELKSEIRNEFEREGMGYLGGINGFGIGASIGGRINAKAIGFFDNNHQAVELKDGYKEIVSKVRYELKKALKYNNDRLERYSRDKAERGQQYQAANQEKVLFEGFLGLLKFAEEIKVKTSGKVLSAELDLSKGDLKNNVKPIIEATRKLLESGSF